jgi:hypothetical protein
MRTMELYVDEGRVNCPLRGDVDLDRCFTCGRLQDYEVTSDSAVVRCTAARGPSSMFPRDSGFFGRTFL